VLVRLRLLRGPPGTSGSLRQALPCGRLTVEIEPPVFCAIGKVLQFLYLCQFRPRPPCCAIVGLISRGALILPVLAPRGRCAVTGEVSSGSRFSAPRTGPTKALLPSNPEELAMPKAELLRAKKDHAFGGCTASSKACKLPPR
jgi:hypothetical protein